MDRQQQHLRLNALPDQRAPPPGAMRFLKSLYRFSSPKVTRNIQVIFVAVRYHFAQVHNAHGVKQVIGINGLEKYVRIVVDG